MTFQQSPLVIAGRSFGAGLPPMIIAEMSGNHNHSLERAFELVDAAAAAGAHALKLQTYTADTMTLDVDSDDFRISDSDSLWNGRYLYELYEDAHTPWEWHAPIFERASAKGMIPFSTPFDDSAVEFLESLGAACYKIASFENTDLPLIRRVAATGKPLIISTGMATVSDIDEAVRTARDAGATDIVLLKCTSTYPASPANTNIATIPHMRELFGCHVGLSDHTMGTGVSVAATALGASVIEKHFTLRRADGGVDSAFSLEPEELAALVVESGRAAEALGAVRYGPTKAEIGSTQFRRSIYISEDLAAGDVLTKDNVRIIRPGFGLPPKSLPQVLGRAVKRQVARGTALSWDMI